MHTPTEVVEAHTAIPMGPPVLTAIPTAVARGTAILMETIDTHTAVGNAQMREEEQRQW